MKSDAKRFGELLATADGLRSVLEDANVRYVMVAPSGNFSFQKLGRRRNCEEPLQRADVERLAACVPNDSVLRWHEWAIRVFQGGSGRSLLVERLPSAVVDRLPNEVLSQLKRQVRRSGNGVIVGRPGASKGALLLWLGMQIPDDSILLISENPPTELPGSHILHVYPPNTDVERRKVERLSRLSNVVFWERVTGSEDLRTLYGFPGARRRWFTLDASSISSALRALLGVMSAGTDARIETIMGLRSSVIGRPEVTNFLVKESEDWVEVYKSEESALDAMGAFAQQDVAQLGLTRRSEKSGTFDAVPPSNSGAFDAIAPSPEPTLPEIPEPESSGIEENTAAGDSLEIAASEAIDTARASSRALDRDSETAPEIVAAPSAPAPEFVAAPSASAPSTASTPAPSAPATTAPRAPDPVLSFDFDDFSDDEISELSEAKDDPFAPSDSFEFPVEESGLEESSASMSAGIFRKGPSVSPTSVENPMTIPIEGYEDSVVEDDEDSIKTGLLQAQDLQGLAQASKVENLPEETRQYGVDRAESQTSNADASILQSLLPKLTGHEPAPPAMNLEDLRITTMEEYEPPDEGSGEFDLDMTNRSDNLGPHTSMDFDDDMDEMDDFSEVVDFDLDISDMLHEDDIATSIAAADDVASAISNHNRADVDFDPAPTVQAHTPDPATSPAMEISYLMQMQDEEPTEEVSLNSLKLAAIKERLSQKK